MLEKYYGLVFIFAVATAVTIFSVILGKYKD